ncbi:Uncharacterised protein [Salmonella enterica subsp. enterica serovar Bovismorbificans]|nr:Uncharacterised protein [Salmonella enterica subsp. enterica serovar Bovismorbificans]
MPAIVIFTYTFIFTLTFDNIREGSAKADDHLRLNGLNRSIKFVISRKTMRFINNDHRSRHLQPFNRRRQPAQERLIVIVSRHTGGIEHLRIDQQNLNRMAITTAGISKT